MRQKRSELRLNNGETLDPLRQNAYYWGVVVKSICAEVGMDTEEVHQELCKDVSHVHKPKYRKNLRKSTASLDTKGMEYLDKCVQWAGEFLYLEIAPPSDDPWWTALKSIKKTCSKDWSPTLTFLLNMQEQVQSLFDDPISQLFQALENLKLIRILSKNLKKTIQLSLRNSCEGLNKCKSKSRN